MVHLKHLNSKATSLYQLERGHCEGVKVLLF